MIINSAPLVRVETLNSDLAKGAYFTLLDNSSKFRKKDSVNFYGIF